jgi:2-amino-4-hydroxy-6-hydroxymethyldihydropteridine diphosphokinase
MAKIAIALGSNLNNPHHQLKLAKDFLATISDNRISTSSIFESEPIGPSIYDFLNAVIVVDSKIKPNILFKKLKKQEKVQGRSSRYPKWTARSIDLDIVSYGEKIIQTDKLTIPHAAYSQRLFVLLPLREVLPNWVDPITKVAIKKLIKLAPQMSITKSNLTW